MKTVISILLVVLSSQVRTEAPTSTVDPSTSSDTPTSIETTDMNITEGATTEPIATTTEELISSTLNPKTKEMNDIKEGKWNSMRTQFAKKLNIANMNKLIFNISLYRDMSDVPCGDNMTHYPGERHVYWTQTVQSGEKLFEDRKGAVEGSNLGTLENLWPTNTQFACANGKAECGLFCSFAPGGEWMYSDIVYGVPGSACGGEVEDELCLPTTLPPKKPKMPEPSEKQSVPVERVDDDDDDHFYESGEEGRGRDENDKDDSDSRRLVSDSGSFPVICSIVTIIFALYV